MPDRLYRSRDDRMLAGVAGGLAELWGADPSLVRVIWALLVIFTAGSRWCVHRHGLRRAGGGELCSGRRSKPPRLVRRTRRRLHGVGRSSHARAEARAARRAARAERGGGMSPGSCSAASWCCSAVLLVREYLPQIDFDWFCRSRFVAVGIILVVSAIGGRRDPADRMSRANRGPLIGGRG